MIYAFISTDSGEKGGGMQGSLAAWKQHKQQNIHLSSVYANPDKLMLIYRKETGKLAN